MQVRYVGMYISMLRYIMYVMRDSDCVCIRSTCQAKQTGVHHVRLKLALHAIAFQVLLIS